MENETLKEYFKSQQKAASFEPEDCTENVKELPSSDKNINKGNVFDAFKDTFQSVKCSMKEMVSNESNHFNNIFGEQMRKLRLETQKQASWTLLPWEDLLWDWL
ncbi:uncharacterized protein G2W53_010232 [Senna tora]|uniref:Uncharacterized protein n=1 Tax=Senna tora TaxID=362788 RepID=A0A834WZJ6_9FABA|nr:uncharacterized protein G2W53_010232 [Senna tora]